MSEKPETRGRKALPDAKRRDRRKVVKLRPDEVQLIEQASGEKPVMVWMREVLLRAAKRKQ